MKRLTRNELRGLRGESLITYLKRGEKASGSISVGQIGLNVSIAIVEKQCSVKGQKRMRTTGRTHDSKSKNFRRLKS
jgi:hypothetical protein